MNSLPQYFDELDHKIVLEKLLVGIIESEWRTRVDHDCYGEMSDYNYLVALDRLFDYVIGETEGVGFKWDDYETFKEFYLENVVRKRAQK